MINTSFLLSKRLAFFHYTRAEQNFSRAAGGLADSYVESASIVRQQSLWFTRFSCIFGMDRTIALTSPTVFETKNKMHMHTDLARARLQHFQSLHHVT